MVLTELQALHTTRNLNTSSPEINTFANAPLLMKSLHTTRPPTLTPLITINTTISSYHFQNLMEVIQLDGFTRQNNILNFKILCQTSRFNWPLSI